MSGNGGNGNFSQTIPEYDRTTTLTHASKCRNEEEFPNPTRAALAVYTDSYMEMARAGRKIGDAFPPQNLTTVLW